MWTVEWNKSQYSDLFRQILTDQIKDQHKHPVIQQINDWEIQSIRRIRKMISEHTNEHVADNIHSTYWGTSDDQVAYIADTLNHRIVEWTSNATSGVIAASENGQGNRPDQLKEPNDVIMDEENVLINWMILRISLSMMGRKRCERRNWWWW